MSDLITRRVVGVDTYLWSTAIPGEPKRRQRHSAERGELIEVTKTEAERGEGLGFLVDPDTEPATESADAAEFAQLSDDDLADLSVEAIEEYLASAPADQRQAELERILDLEAKRPKPRKTVIALGAPSTPFEAKSVDELEAMDEAEILAYLNTVPADLHDDVVDQVLEIESLRDEPRVAIQRLDPNFQGDPADAAGDPSTAPRA